MARRPRSWCVGAALLLGACGGGADPASDDQPAETQPSESQPSETQPSESQPSESAESQPDLAGSSLVDEVVAVAPVPEPTSVVPLADGTLLVADRSGLIVRIDGGTVTTVADLSARVLSSGLRGLLGLAVHPRFPGVPEAYAMSTTDPGFGDSCADPCVAPGALSRLDWDGAAFTETVLIEGWCQMFSSHSPDDVAVLDDGTVLASAGDGAISGFDDPACPEPAGMGGSMRAQDVFVGDDPVDYVGTIVRVDRSGAAVLGPDDADRIVAAGLRNPFRITVDRPSGRVFAVDAGDFQFESVDEIDPEAVHNHGWPCFEADQFGPGGATPWCQALAYESTVPAVLTYASTEADVSPDDDGRCAPGDQGTTVSAVATAPGELVGSPDDRVLVFGDYGRRCLWWAPLTPTGVGDPHLLATDVPGPTDLELGPDGSLYYVAYETASIHRLTQAG